MVVGIMIAILKHYKEANPEVTEVFLRSGMFFMKGASLIYLLTGFNREYLYSSRYSSCYSFSLLMYSKNCFFILSQLVFIIICERK